MVYSLNVSNSIHRSCNDDKFQESHQEDTVPVKMQLFCSAILQSSVWTSDRLQEARGCVHTRALPGCFPMQIGAENRRPPYQ